METIEFGHYNQTVDNEPIQWYILNQSDNEMLLISKYVLFIRYFNFIGFRTSWSKSDLRKYLHYTFIEEAFSKEEREQLRPVVNVNDPNSIYKTRKHDITQDLVFLLNSDEAEKYLPDKELRKGHPTLYARGMDPFIKDGAVYWWLRTAGKSDSSACFVDTNGNIAIYGENIGNERTGVRPCIKIKVEK